jgi:hypothetical protein
MSVGLQPAPHSVWFKSSYSGGNATECVECSYLSGDALIRDSKLTDGPVLSVSAETWGTFVSALRRAVLGE